LIIGIKDNETKKILIAGITGHERPFAEDGKNIK